MIKFRNMMDMVIDGQDSIICVAKETNADTPKRIKEMMLAGKYWIRKKDSGEIFPAFPGDLMEADSGMAWATSADYLIIAPEFDQEAYWNENNLNASRF